MLILGGNIKQILKSEQAKKNIYLEKYINYINTEKKKCSSCIPKDVKRAILSLLETNESVKQLFKEFLKVNRVEFYILDKDGHKQLKSVEL